MRQSYLLQIAIKILTSMMRIPTADYKNEVNSDKIYYFIEQVNIINNDE